MDIKSRLANIPSSFPQEITDTFALAKQPPIERNLSSVIIEAMVES
jgi:hypothetical protein